MKFPDKYMKRPLISVVVNTLNEEKNLPRCLNSVRSLAEEIIVVDMESNDATREIAAGYGAVVFRHRRMGYVEPARNFAINKARGKWILILDADEKIGKFLAKKLKSIALSGGDFNCVLIPRRNIIFGKWMQNSRWWPDYLPRFFKKGEIKWPKQIHQQPNLADKKIVTLLDSEKMAITHYNYENLNQFLERGGRYAQIQAEELLKEKNYKLSSKDLILKPMGEFLSRFFSGEAYKDGVHGLILSLLQAWVTFLTYLKVWEISGYEEKPLETARVKEIFKEVGSQLEYWRNDLIIKTQKGPLSPLLKWFLKIRSGLIKL